MFRFSHRSVPFVSLDISKVRLAAIDTFNSQDFNINECGFIRNDISLLARAQSQSEFDAIMRRIGSVEPIYDVHDGETLQQAFDSIRPRHLQSSSELAAFAENFERYSQSAYSDVKVPSSETSSPIESSVSSEGSQPAV